RMAARRTPPEMLAVLGQFRILFKSIRRHYHHVERQAGISGAQLWALAEVAANPGVEVGRLAKTLAIHQSTASNLLRRLQTQKLVSRKREAKDQRAVQLLARERGLFAGAAVVAAACAALGVPFEFVLFGLTLTGVALFHHHTLQVALIGLGAIVLYKLAFTGFKAGPGMGGLALHMLHEW